MRILRNIKTTDRRHSRVGGNPDLYISEIFKDYCKSKLPDSRLRGNDGHRKINALPQIIKLENLTLIGRLKWQKQNIPHGSMGNILMGQ